MKPRLFFIFVIVIYLTSCDPEWALNPPRIPHFYVENDSNKDVTIGNEWMWEDVWRLSYTPKLVKKGTTVEIEIHHTYPGDDRYIPSILLCVSDTYREERFRLIVDDEVVRVWNRAEIGTGIPHHFYDDESWVLDKYQTGNDNYYTYYEWTYTITDEDITPEQR